MEALQLLLLRVDMRDYPDYAACERASEYPGLALCEYSAATGMRWAVPLGYAASVLYYYLVHRPRLSFADRAHTRLHHFFYPSAGYSTPIGVLGGVAYGTADTTCSLTPTALETTAAREKAAAVMAAAQYAQRRRVAETRLRAEASAASRALVWLRLREDPVQAELARMGLGEAHVAWEALLVPHGYLWTRQHSCVHDVARYRGYDGPLVPTAASTSLPSPSSSSARAARPASEAYFTKEQVDAVVSRLATRRTSTDEDRWMRSAGRCGCYGVLSMLLAWNSGGALFRAQMGLGLGVVVGAIASATRVDQMYVNT